MDAGDPIAQGVLSRLTEVPPGHHRAIEEAVLAAELWNVACDSQTVFGGTCSALGKALRQGVKLATGGKQDKVGDARAVLRFDTSPRIVNAVGSLAHVWALRASAKKEGMREWHIHLAMEGVVHINTLVRDILWRSFSPKAAKLSESEKARVKEQFLLFENPALRSFVNLAWISGIPMPLGDLRNAWVHGDAHISGEKLLVYFEDSDELRAELSLDDLDTYLTLGECMWNAVMLLTCALHSHRESKKSFTI